MTAFFYNPCLERWNKIFRIIPLTPKGSPCAEISVMHKVADFADAALVSDVGGRTSRSGVKPPLPSGETAGVRGRARERTFFYGLPTITEEKSNPP